MPNKSAVDEYFAPDTRRELIDRAALIVALVEGRESATRTDYAHPKLSAIVEVLKTCASPAAQAHPGTPAPPAKTTTSRKR